MPLRWPPAITERRKELERNFKISLTAIAERAAIHERADSVSEIHLDSGYQTLSRLGLSRRRFSERAESQTALGAFLIGAAISCPTAVQALVPEKYASALSLGLLLGFSIIGFFFLIRGWYVGKFPPVPKPRRTVWQWIFIATAWALFLASLFVVGNSLIQRYWIGLRSCAPTQVLTEAAPSGEKEKETHSVIHKISEEPSTK
jgi:hypothetical protein